MEQKRKKVYVGAGLEVSADGTVMPVRIDWPDGRKFEVDRVKQVCRAASTKVGGCGIRYTVMICGKETYLFREDDKWFVEAKETG